MSLALAQSGPDVKFLLPVDMHSLGRMTVFDLYIFV